MQGYIKNSVLIRHVPNWPCPYLRLSDPHGALETCCSGGQEGKNCAVASRYGWVLHLTLT